MWLRFVLDLVLPLGFFAVLSSHCDLTDGLPVVYDQKQIGDLNVRAELENVSVLFIPNTSRFYTSLLTGLIEMKGGLGKSAIVDHHHHPSKDAINQPSVNFKQVPTQVEEDDRHPSKDELNQAPVTLKQVVVSQDEKNQAPAHLEQISANEKVSVRLGVSSPSSTGEEQSKDQLNQPPVTLKQISNKEELEHKEKVLTKNVGIIIGTEVKAELPPQIEAVFKPDNKKPSQELQEAIKVSKTDAMEPVRIIKDRISAAANEKTVLAQSPPVALRVGLLDKKRKAN